MNAEFQRIVWRYKKAFLGDQCKGIGENGRMGKIRDLFKKNWRYQGNISCKNGHDKDRNGKDLTEAEEIRKRWQEYAEVLKTQINMTVWSFTYSQTSWSVNSSELLGSIIVTKLLEVIEFQLSYFKS